MSGGNKLNGLRENDELLDFLRSLNNTCNMSKIEERFAEFLSNLSKEDVKGLLLFMSGELGKERPDSSPTVAEAVERCLQMRDLDLDDLQAIIGIERKELSNLLQEGYRLTDLNIKPVSESLATLYHMANPTAFRQLLGDGLRYLMLGTAPVQSIRAAARKK